MTTVTWEAVAAEVRARPAGCGATRVVAVDGPAGSGKSTVAAALAPHLGDAPVVGLDDLYDGWERALSPQLAADVERWLLQPWSLGLPGRHRVFDWAAGSYGGWRTVPAAPVVLLEGVGSGQRALRPFLSLLLWVEAPGVDTLARVVERDGEQVREPMLRWREREAAHFAAERTRDAADLRVDGVRRRAPRGS